MYCKFCGSQMDDAAMFCSKCGKSTNDNNSAVEEAQSVQNNKKKQAPFLVCLLVSIFIGVIIGVLSGIIGGEFGLLMFASIAAGIVFAMALSPLFSNSHISGILTFVAFILGCFIYYPAFSSIEEIATESIIQEIGFYFYMCSPYAMLVLIWTELSRDNIGVGRIIKIIVIWFVLLVALFLGFKIESNLIENQRESDKSVKEIKEESEDTQLSTEKIDIIPATTATEINDTNTGDRTLEESIANNESNVDMEESELSQILFNAINYALSIGATSNCDMSQESLKKLYEKIEDGSFFEESLFTYITEYGKERYNYEIEYDGLVLCVYYDPSEDLYGFDILKY